MRLIYLFMTFCLLLSSCSPTWRRKLSTPRTDYNGRELQTDGFYYNKDFGTFILYKNGIYLGGYSAITGVNSVEGVLSFWQNSRYLADYKKDPTNWGVFKINGNSVTIEKWFGRNWGEPLQTARIIGKVLNDSMVVMTESFFPPQHKVKSDTFHFYPMWLKPDSTNPFIK